MTASLRHRDGGVEVLPVARWQAPATDAERALLATLHGPVNTKWLGHRLEISPREILAVAPLMALLVVVGVWPSWLVSVINATVIRMLG